MTVALNKSTPYDIPRGRGRLTFDAGADAMEHRLSSYKNNGISRNRTLKTNGAQSEPYYRQVLPREVATFLIVSVLQYWWFVALEKMLPARPGRYNSLVQFQQGEKVLEESEDREEEVVKKWIAQGRVRRASLNWCNTFLKWMLDMTVGRLCCFAVESAIKIVISKLQSTPDSALRSPTRVCIVLHSVFSLFFCAHF
jgi:hypothetical protein